MCDSVTIAVKPDGSVVCIYDDALLPLMQQGQSITQRASHVEPAPEGAGWEADMSPVNGPLLTGFETRTAALAAEREYINANVL